MATIYIDNKPYQVKDGQNLLHAGLSLGFNIPYFCWHPAFGSVGACRQCAVKQYKDENDTKGNIVMACMTPATDGTRISIDDPEVRDFRASVIEWLMVNHPHDCPVCDEGGECHLQDMTVMTGHDYRKFRFKKRTHRNQYLGPFINHEMNRCIACYRCVRFYRDYAGGRDLDVFGAHDHVYFGRHQDGVLQNEFSGNLVEVCPTGVFTDKTLKQHYTRKWDLQTAPSICVHCGLGCNTIPGERYGSLRRIRSRYNSKVNGYFICDRGRYGYEFVNDARRIRQPLRRMDKGGNVEPVSKEAAVKLMASILSKNSKMIGIGSRRASLEANFALRTLVGAENFYSGTPEREFHLIKAIIDIMSKGPARSPSLHDIEQADAVFVLGEDVTNVAPMIDLALKQSVRRQPMKLARKFHIEEWNDAAMREIIQDKKGPLFIATPSGTRLDEFSTKTFRGAPDDLARLGFAVAHALNAESPSVSDLSDEMHSIADTIAQALKEAARPLVISGTSCGSETVVQAAANVAWALCRQGRAAELCFTVPECNSMGLAMMAEKGLDSALKSVEKGRADTVIILENDLFRREDKDSIDKFLSACQNVVVIDHLENAINLKADFILPAATFAEGDGTLVNSEGRAQRFFQVFIPNGEIQESWRWLGDIMNELGRKEAARWSNLDGIIVALCEAMPIFKPIANVAPPADLRLNGQKIPRQPHRYSGRTAMCANINVHEPKPPNDPDSALAFSMEGSPLQPPSSLLSNFWAPGWNSIQSLNKFQIEVGGPLHNNTPGARLIEPSKVEKAAFFDAIPAAFKQRDGEWLVVPLYHIYGSEELSRKAPAVAELVPKPYLALNPQDAAALKVGENELVELTLNGSAHRLPVKLLAHLARGVAVIPAGVADLPAMVLPAWNKISKVLSK
jgi:NADH-quinone oxidoreductase subunit G